MKSSPMILALLSAAAVCWAGEPTPSPTSSPTPIPASALSPPDGAVYQVGEPILIEQEFTDGCGGGAPGDFLTTPRRLIRLISESTIHSVVLAELTPETIRVSIPGNYEIVRFCTSGTFDGEETVNTFTVEAPCPLLNPEPTPAPTGAPVPWIWADATAGSGNEKAVVTVDNSLNRIYYLRIRNVGNADLVLISLRPWIEFDSISFDVPDFVPYTVVRPGYTVYYPVSVVVNNPSVFSHSGIGNFEFLLTSNDPARPVVFEEVGGFRVFNTADEIPDSYILVSDPPENPPTPECADQNADGTVDASDVVNFILQR